MKALVMTAKQHMEIEDRDVPTPKDDEVLVETAYAGICGTDHALYNGLPGSADATPPIVLGHENSGVVSAVGKNVKDFKKGDRVVVDPNIYCDKCFYCHTGRYELCENLSAVGVTRDGGLEDYFTAPEKVVYHIPDELSLQTACSMEPLSCAVHTMKITENITPYQHALIIGDGYMAKLFAQLLRIYGIQNIDMTGRHDDNLAWEKKELNLNKVINTTKEKITDKYDMVIECVGKPETQEQAVEATNPGAQVMMFGVGAPGQTFNMNTYEIFKKQLTIKGSMINPHSFEDSIALLSDGSVKVKPFQNNILTLEQVPGVLAGTDKVQGKSIVKVNGDLK
ncbi:zinc-dependent alcohol dehydrogenase family protein [Fructilactobacillus fructivorans]|nr:zinc-dependent alcohol dehydrogenase family protein [Fructilactobacillus fructivorans]MCT0151478.1 alcohol dehydrogenase [Fructilactobacillus fructivorans]MCT2866997.1 alcohol dehydrogenase [Fructilactobacillus fructivorans]MCT2869298.1 alcohol dehydrogenase [Fructilactobacillus fructivorans]MCT2873665.1 alcohol dehydrogenase [Fructilactobacillus fructivorans]QFX93348.1 alcohol dehydrogenase catalytic domain-containing protein [Fructilactobacillus fructivorans]